MTTEDKSIALFILVFFGPIFLVLGCCNDPKPVLKPEIDNTVYERVFLECVKLARGPNSLTAAGNDTDEAVEACRSSARDIARK